MSTESKQFTKASFSKAFILPALLLFVIPLFSWWFFHHVQADYDAQFLAAVERSIKKDTEATEAQRAKLLEYFQRVPVSQIVTSSDPKKRSLVSENMRFRLAVFRWMIRISVFSVVSGIAVFVVAGLSVLFSLRSQLAQYYSLSVGWHLLRVFSTLQVLAQGTLVVALSFWVTAYWFQSYIPKLIILAAILALAASAAIIAAIFKKIDDKFEIDGCVIERTPESPLWADLDRICKTVGTAPPDRIIAGIDNNFFVTEHPITVEGKVHTGRTLYVSLSLLKVLQGSQADAVMAHEMAHFSGNDTLYSRKISPLLNRYEIYLQALSQGLALPVFYYLMCFRALFQISLGKLRKQREFRADQIAAQVTSPQDIAQSLLKISAYSEYRHKVEQELFDTENVLESVNISHRVATGFNGFACAFAKEGKLAELETAHPFDSHPPTKERWEAVGIRLTPDDMPPILTREPDSRWYRNIERAEELEQKQWAAYEEKFQKFHEQILAYRYLPETETEKAVVLKHFPEVSFPGKKQGTLTFDYEKISYTEWEDPIQFSEITKCTGEQSALGHPQIRIDFTRDKAAKRILPLDKFQVDKQQIIDAFNKYYSRHVAMKEYRKSKQESAQPTDTSATTPPPSTE